jgi:hypothetical protein
MSAATLHIRRLMMSEDIMNTITDALDVYTRCKCKSDFPGREDEPRVQSGDKILAKYLKEEIHAGRFMFYFDKNLVVPIALMDVVEVDCD